MRGTILSFGENYQAEYYDLVPIKNSKKTGLDKTGGILHNEYSKIPQSFKYSETSISGATVFQSLKGLEISDTSFGDVYQTHSIKYKIQTSNTKIDFKINGKIIMFVNGERKSFIIKKITYLTAYLKGFSGSRINEKNIDFKKLPKVLELA